MKTLSIMQPGVEIRSLSSELSDREYMLYVKLPWTYDRTDQRYPALYCLDGNRSFPFYSTMSLIYESPGANAEETIVIGIGYNVDENRIAGLADWASWRTFDLTPERDEEVESFRSEALSKSMDGQKREIHTGGAQGFLRSVAEEIIPYVESLYRISSTRRGLAGYSYGGLFTLYTLFHASDLFSHYLAGSPTMWDQLFRYEEEYGSNHDDLMAKVYLTAGSQEAGLVERLQRLIRVIRLREYPRLELDFNVFEGEGHTSAYPCFVGKALRYFYDTK